MSSLEIALKSLDLLSLFWLVSSILIVCAHIILHLQLKPTASVVQFILDLLKPLYYFGKLKQIHVKADSSDERFWVLKLIRTLSSFPKRWFSHFYVAGLMVHSLIFLLVVLIASKAVEVPEFLQRISTSLHWFEPQGTANQVQSLYPVLIVLACEEIQLLRRVYECLFISSFSKGTISIIHYFYGVAFYIMFGFGIMISIPVHRFAFSYALNPSDVIYLGLGMFGFFVASYLQHKTMKTFAGLRFKEKDKQARGHYIPQGHLFQWVSSPHYLCEILLYLSLCLMMRWRNTYLVCSTVFVLVNQVSASLSVHSWYKQTFHNYPKSRKALVPYLL